MSAEGRRAKVRVQDLTLGIYETVIDDTVSRIKAEFVQEGVDESVLEELRTLWEQNILKSGVIGKDAVEENHPQGEQKEAALKPSSSAAAQGNEPPSTKEAPTGAVQVAIQPTPAAQEVVLNPATLKIQQQPQFAVHSQSMLHKAPPSLTTGANAALKDVSQHEQPDGTNAVGAMQTTTDATGITGQKRAREELDDNGEGHNADIKFGVPAPTVIPQCDGAGEGDEGKGDEDDLLNEEDDLADADDHEEVDEDAIKNVILGQFDKVHRTKAKWRINLKNCVATINGTDYLLKKITGEMNFA